jgi:hypothetical protein
MTLAPVASASRYRLIFLAVLMAVYGGLAIWPDIMTVFGVGKLDIWFRDTHAMLAASDSAQAGYDLFVKNPYDLSHERHIYSDWWYLLGRMGLDRDDYLWVGFGVVLAFWLAVVAVLPLHTRRDLWWSLALCLSPPFWLAVNRANPDLLVFALLTLTVSLLMHHRLGMRLLSPWPVALVTGLKYFPILGGIILLRPSGSRRENWLRAGVILVLGGLLVWSLWDDVQNYLDVSWVARGQFIFGAMATPANYGWVMDSWLMLGRVTGIGLVVICVVLPSTIRPVDIREVEMSRLYALMGAALLAGNFFLTIGYFYKVVFAVWLLPACFDLQQQQDPLAKQAKWFLGALIAMVWLEPIMRASDVFWADAVEQSGLVAVRRGTAVMANVLGWVAMVPAVRIMGGYLRQFWSRPAEGALP